MRSCHHYNSRRFVCACGAMHEWEGGAEGRPEMAFQCPCGRWHKRGADGPHDPGPKLKAGRPRPPCEGQR